MRCMQRTACAGALGALALLAALPAGAADSIRAVGSFPAEHSSSRAMERLAQELAKTTFDRLTIAVEADPELEPGGVVQIVQDGEAALGWTEVEALGRLVPAYGVMTLPFLFDDQAALFALLESADGLGLLLDDQLMMHGLTTIGFMDGGGRRIASTTGAIQSTDQLDGQRILIDGSEDQLAAMAATGMAPVVAGGGGSDEAELREARLEALRGDASAGGLTIADAPHATDVIVVVANRAALDDLALDLHELLVATIAPVAAWQRGIAAEADAAAQRDLREQGAAFAPLPAEVREELRARIKESVVQGAAPNDPLIEAVLAQVD